VSSSIGWSSSLLCGPSSPSDISIISTSEFAGRLRVNNVETVEELRGRASVGAMELAREPDRCDVVEMLRLLATDAGRDGERSPVGRSRDLFGFDGFESLGGRFLSTIKEYISNCL
jgi:hypothetical protein